MVADKLYLMDGSITYELDATRRLITRKKDMIRVKEKHSLCSLYYEIFSIGGYTGYD